MSELTYDTSGSVAYAPSATRADFIRKTYIHVAMAIAAFAVIEAMLFQIPGIEDKVFGLLAKSSYSWLIVLGAFMLVSHIADRWAQSSVSKGMQYLGLGLYVVAEALIFLPLLLMANEMVPGGDLIWTAAVLTGVLFAALTFVAFTSGKDFSFLGGFLKVGFIVALGLIVLSIFVGFNLGTIFSGVMVVLAGASILYSTSNVMHHYRETQYVAAALSLFASVALMFWYILRLVMAFGRD